MASWIKKTGISFAKIPVAFVGVEFHREASHITNSVCASTGSLDRTEADEDGSLPSRVGEDGRICPLGGTVVEDTEVTVRACAASVDDTLWDTLMVEPVDLLSGDLVLEKGRSSVRSVGDFEPVIRVRHLHAMVSCDALSGRRADRVGAKVLDLGGVGDGGDGVLDVLH